MNKKGHPANLVASHPGNQNAVKAGVFSPRTRAPRVEELSQALMEHSGLEIAIHVCHSEIARLQAWTEAIDDDLSQQGIVDRRGQPRTMLNVRLRANSKLRASVAELCEYESQRERLRPAVAASERSADRDEENASPETLPDRIARLHFRDSIEDLEPVYFDPKLFLRAVIQAEDPAITIESAARARKLLTKRERRENRYCACPTSQPARDPIEFREWLEYFRDVVEPNNGADPTIASQVRRLASDERLEPWSMHRARYAAVEQVARDALERTQSAPVKHHPARPPTREHDGSVYPFWLHLLGADESISPKDRLTAFVQLEEMEVLPTCACPSFPNSGLDEVRADMAVARIIRVVAQQNRFAARTIVDFPATYVAVQEIVDRALVNQNLSMTSLEVKAYERQTA